MRTTDHLFLLILLSLDWAQYVSTFLTSAPLPRFYRHHDRRQPSRWTPPRSTASEFEYWRNRRKVKPKANRDWLQRVTTNFLLLEPGNLEKGKWHEVVSIFSAWGARAKVDAEAPIKMEALLKRLLEEQKAGNQECMTDMEIYNKLLDAWACAALFKTHDEIKASQRAREILVSLQENYEETDNASLKPNAESFDLVLHVVCKVEGALIARRVLAWMEYLHKSGKNKLAKPTRTDYVIVLDTYANSGDTNAGLLAEGFLRHMNISGVTPDTLCYNIAIKAWNKSRRGRDAAEHAERILYEMDAEPDLVTYASVISAWAASGMRAHAVTRSEKLLQQLEADHGLEPNTIVLNAVMSSWVKSRNPAAAQRTAEILRRMERSENCQPDLFSYNTHLHALSLNAKRLGCAEKAAALLQRLEDMYDKQEIHFHPNLFSYNLVIESFCRSPHPKSALLAAGVLRKLIKRDGVEPDTFSFNQVLASLSRSSMKDAPRIAEQLLLYQEDSFRSGVHSNARPDIHGYTSVIAAYSRSGVRGAAERAHDLLDLLKRRYAAGEDHLKPTIVCYNCLIDGWAKSGERTLGARKAESLLQEMQDMYAAGDTSMKPNIRTYNAVLNAWAQSGTRCCGYKAERYLNRMWELYNLGDTKIKPNDFSYNTVINAISKSKNEGKAQKALRILRRMDKLYQAGNKEARPNEVTYTAVINSCAFPAVLDSRTRRKALATAIFTLEELQSSRYGQPNQVTYSTFLRAVGVLLDDDDKLRRDVVERAFKQCCKDGQVGAMVLSHLRKAAPLDLYEELLADFISPDSGISIKNLPHEWRCNVRENEKRKSSKARRLSKKQDKQVKKKFRI